MCKMSSCLLSLLLLCAPLAAHADDPAPILGNWRTVTDMGARKSESVMEFKLVNGALAAIGKGQRGSIDAYDVSFEGGVLKWKINVRGNAIPVEVTVTGDTFEGFSITPLGKLKTTGQRITAEQQAAEDAALRAMVGDWTIYTTYNNNQHESKMRLFVDDDDDMLATIIMQGSTVTSRRVRLEGDTLRINFAMPFVSAESAILEAKVADNKFEGTVRSAVGDIPIMGELVDTTKLVVAPYDQPEPILGEWSIHAVLRDKEHDGTLSFSEKDSRLHAVLKSGEKAYEASSVEFKKVSDTMSVARVTLTIPEVAEKPLVFELVVDGDAFEGEELYSNGELLMSGSRAKA